MFDRVSQLDEFCFIENDSNGLKEVYIDFNHPEVNWINPNATGRLYDITLELSGSEAEKFETAGVMAFISISQKDDRLSSPKEIRK